MPLKGGGAKNIGSNIKELEQNVGTRPRSHKQIVAIALDVARKSGADIPVPKAKKK